MNGKITWPAARVPALALASPLGACAALLQFAGALKSTPLIAALPVDLTLLAGLLLAGPLLLMACGRRWWLSPTLAGPLAASALLWLWLVLAGCWSASSTVLAQKLTALVLLGPVMLLAGLILGADPASLRRFAGMVVVVGAYVAAAIGWGLWQGGVVLGGEGLTADPAQIRVQYQLVGLAIASAGGVVALRLMVAPGRWRLPWLLLLGVLGFGTLLPGGRAALLAFASVLCLPPVLLLWRQGQRGAALLWLAALAGMAALGVLLLAALPWISDDLRTLDRLFQDGGSQTSARLVLWGEALRWAGLSMPWGLGTGGFPQAAGFGDDRGFYPHNHALEALAEGGLPGLLLWLGSFGLGAVVALRLGARSDPLRQSLVLALVLPLALTAMVSTDLGNRMVWFALGLALSLGVEHEPP